jgi:hypothetical protein
MGKVKGFYTDEKGKVRPITAKEGRCLAKPTIFFPAKSKKYSEIVRIDTPEAAEASAVKLLKEFANARTRDKRVRIKRSVVLAENRARAMANNERLSPAQREEAREVAQIYAAAKEMMTL